MFLNRRLKRKEYGIVINHVQKDATERADIRMVRCTHTFYEFRPTLLAFDTCVWRGGTNG